MSDELTFPVVVGDAIILLGGALVLLALARRGASPRVRNLIIASLIGHFVVGVLLQYGGLASDAREYHLDAIRLSAYWSGGVPTGPVLTDGKQGWVWVLSAAYFVVAPHMSLGIAINAVFLAAVPLIMFKIVSEFSTPQVADRAALLIFLVPAQWLWGSLPLREAAVTLILSLTVWSTMAVIKSGRGIAWITLGLSLVALLAFRGSLSIVVSAAVVAVLIFTTVGRNSTASAKLLAVPAIIALGFFGQVALSTAGSDVSVERVGAIRDSQSSNASTGFDTPTSTAGGVGGTVTNAIAVFPRILAGPFPWEISGSLVALLPDALYWWFAVVMTVRGSRTSVGRREALALLLPLLGLVIALSAYSGNYGTMMRIRASGLVYMIPLAALAFRDRSGRGNKTKSAGPLREPTR